MATSIITIPEYILLDIVKKSLQFLRADYAANSDPEKSYLRLLLKNSGLERYDSVTQVEAIFLKEIDDPRYLDVSMMWNMNVEKVPAIYVALPSETTQPGGNGLGVDEGYQDYIFEDTEFDNNGDTVTPGSFRSLYTRRFESTYGIIVTSDNSNEVVIIYHVLKNMMISLMPTISLMGLQNVVLGGNDVNIKSDLIPKNMFMRSLTLRAQYETSAPDIFKHTMFQHIFAHGTPVNE
jgi:hypothetical protein